MDLNSNNFDPIGNFNRLNNDKFFSKIIKSAIENLKKLPLIIKILLLTVPLIFISIGLTYRDWCWAKPYLPLYLILFGILILLNFAIYVLVGSNFLVCKIEFFASRLQTFK